MCDSCKGIVDAARALEVMAVGADSWTRRHFANRHFANRPFPRRFNARAKGAVICAGDGQIRQVDTRQVGQYLGAVLSSVAASPFRAMRLDMSRSTASASMSESTISSCGH